MNILPWSHSDSVDVKHERTPLTSLQREINRAFDSFFNDFSSPSLFAGFDSNPMLSPSMDITENGKRFNIKAEMPGMDSENVEVSVNDNYLTIKGKKDEESVDQDDNYVRRERHFGSYQRSIALPDSVDADNIKAEFKKGVLTVEIPKKADASKTARKIDIKSAA